MGWQQYLINHTKKVIINAGKCDKDNFYDHAKKINNIEISINEDIYDLKISDLTLDQSRQIYKLVEQAELMNQFEFNLVAILLYLRWTEEGDQLELKIDPDDNDYLEL